MSTPSEPSAKPEDIASQGFNEIYTTAALNCMFGAALLLLFEIKRKKKSVYGQRYNKFRHRAPPYPPNYPFGWIMTTRTIRGRALLRMIGLDGYMLLRFCRLCMRICWFGTFYGMCILAPIYSTGKGEAKGFYKITLANVRKGSDVLWVAVAFTYLFTWHVLYLINKENKLFAEMRAEFFAKGDSDFYTTQARFSVMVERIPPELQSNVALQGYFESLFPSQVHSAVMCLDLRRLENLVKERDAARDRLEKEKIKAKNNGLAVQPPHRTRRFFCDCWGRAEAVDSVTYMEEELDQLNLKVAREQEASLEASNQLNRMDNELLQTLQRRFEDTAEVLKQKLNPYGWWGQSEQKRTGSFDAAEAGGAPASAVSPISGSSGGGVTSSASAGGRAMMIGERDEAAATAAKEAAAAPALGILSALTFVGGTAVKGASRMTRNMMYLTLGERMSTTGFVTFKSMTARAGADQMLLTQRPMILECTRAPERAEIVWENVPIPQEQANLRHVVSQVALTLGAIFYSIPVTFIQAITSIGELSKYLPFLKLLDPNSVWYALISGYLPVLALIGLIALLPYFFELITVSYEGCKLASEVQALVMTRLFIYQMANIYFSVTAGSFFQALTDIVNKPSDILTILGKSFPSVAVYFTNFVLVKLLVGLPLELSCLTRMLQVTWAQKVRKKQWQTQRELQQGAFASPKIMYGWLYPTLLLVLVVCLLYAVISPFILPVGALYFGGCVLVYKYQMLYVYLPDFEGGGVLWFDVCGRIYAGLILAQLTVAGYVSLRGGYTQSSLMLPLPLFVIWFSYNNKYEVASKRISLEMARHVDEERKRLLSKRDEYTPDWVSLPRDRDADEQMRLRDVDDINNFDKDYYAQPAMRAPAYVSVKLPDLDDDDDDRRGGRRRRGGPGEGTNGGGGGGGGGGGSASINDGHDHRMDRGGRLSYTSPTKRNKGRSSRVMDVVGSSGRGGASGHDDDGDDANGDGEEDSRRGLRAPLLREGDKGTPYGSPSVI